MTIGVYIARSEINYSVSLAYSRKNTTTGVLGIRAGVHTYHGSPVLRRALLPAFDVLDCSGRLLSVSIFIPNLGFKKKQRWFSF